MHTVFECHSIDTLWQKIKNIFDLKCDNYEVLALTSQLIYNRIKLSPKEEKKFRTDNTFIASHINYLINRETKVDSKNLLKSLLDRLD